MVLIMRHISGEASERMVHMNGVHDAFHLRKGNSNIYRSISHIVVLSITKVEKIGDWFINQNLKASHCIPCYL